MNVIKNSLIAAAFVTGAFTMGSASAITLDSIPGVSGSSLNVQVNNGVATLSGTADSGAERALVKAYVAKMDNVDRVIDLVTFQ